MTDGAGGSTRTNARWRLAASIPQRSVNLAAGEWTEEQIVELLISDGYPEDLQRFVDDIRDRAATFEEEELQQLRAAQYYYGPEVLSPLDNAALDMQTIEWGRILDRRMAEYDRQIAQMRQADRDRGPDQGYGY